MSLCKWVFLSFSTMFLLSLLIAPGLLAQTEDIPEIVESSEAPGPPSDVSASDNPNDAGGSIAIRWKLSQDDGAGADNVTGYEVLRSSDIYGAYRSIGFASAGSETLIDHSAEDGSDYYYKVKAISVSGSFSESLPSNPASSSPQWINLGKANVFIIALIISVAIIYFIERAKGTGIFVRKIAGLEAVDEAVGRATEMGKSILFVPGIQDMDNVQTIAGVTILGRIAKTIAEYETKLNVPVSRSLVMTAARETVKESYYSAGRPDAYNDDIIYYLTDAQFGYVAAVDGIMVRERPAACFYLGAFYAESLILAETGNSIGAIQIAGTAMPAQLPFFVAACDYTLIGEELFAASAYLSNDPRQLGSLKGQDVGKMIAMAAILLGVAFATFSSFIDAPSLGAISDFIIRLFTVQAG